MNIDIVGKGQYKNVFEESEAHSLMNIQLLLQAQPIEIPGKG